MQEGSGSTFGGKPKVWKGQLAQDTFEAAEEAAVEEAMRISADPLPIGAGN